MDPLKYFKSQKHAEKFFKQLEDLSDQEIRCYVKCLYEILTSPLNPSFELYYILKDPEIPSRVLQKLFAGSLDEILEDFALYEKEELQRRGNPGNGNWESR